MFGNILPVFYPPKKNATMKKRYKYFIGLWLFMAISQVNYAAPPDKVDELLRQWVTETRNIQQKYHQKKNLIYQQIYHINTRLTKSLTTEEKVNLLVQKDLLRQQLQNLADAEKSDIQKIRYLKGLSIIKLLYEKVLSLDHHFSSLVTFNEINKISNPTNYPEFEKVRELIKQKSSKKNQLKLTNLLGQNMYTATIDMFIGLFNADANPKEKEAELKNIQCILDFTLRMNNDLKTIYFETSFLQKSNLKIKQNIENLFKLYTKPIGYYTPLKDCRANDDWDAVREKLNTYLDKKQQLAQDSTKIFSYQRMIINLNFPIDRLLQFINEYNIFIDQGVQYYQKFKIILNSYENQRQCSSSLPIEYTKLKSDIDIAIEKFNTAYRPVEINGTKMKQLLYGINEYE